MGNPTKGCDNSSKQTPEKSEIVCISKSDLKFSPSWTNKNGLAFFEFFFSLMTMMMMMSWVRVLMEYYRVLSLYEFVLYVGSLSLFGIKEERYFDIGFDFEEGSRYL